jgi:cell division septation protein DedD
VNACPECTPSIYYTTTTKQQPPKKPTQTNQPPNSKLAVQWHPDKHPTNKAVAQEKFQEVQAAYTALMTTSEDDRVEQLAGGGGGGGKH